MSSIEATWTPSDVEPIDFERWPDLASQPSGLRTRIHASVAERLLYAAAKRTGVAVRRVGEPVRAEHRDLPTLVLVRPEEFFARVGRHGLIGFGEAYQSGAWTSPDVAAVLTALCREMPNLVPGWMQKLRAAYVARPPSEHLNEVGNTQRNISAHYDLSNELFATFLDASMSYSSALFDDERPVTEQSMHEAQLRKIDRILDQAQVGAGTRLLEIGTGWGELAIRAAARGAEVVSVTLSVEQQQLARKRIAEAGYAEVVDVQLRDYRQVEGTFDAVVSVEMIEAVGHEYWGTYFEKIDALLAPGGKAVIQGITMPHDRMLATKNTHTWIKKYIFPGGFLPSLEVIVEITENQTALRLNDNLAFGLHYAETLRRWQETFVAKQTEVLAQGFDETFCRTWEFYLAYSRAGFAASYLQVRQLTFEKVA